MSAKIENLVVIWWLEKDKNGHHSVSLTDYYSPQYDSEPLTDDEAWEEVCRQKSCLIEWLRKNPMPDGFRFIEGGFNRWSETFDGYGNPWEGYDPNSDDEIHWWVNWNTGESPRIYK